MKQDDLMKAKIHEPTTLIHEPTTLINVPRKTYTVIMRFSLQTHL